MGLIKTQLKTHKKIDFVRETRNLSTTTDMEVVVWNEFLYIPVWNLDLSVSGAIAYVQLAIPVTPPAIRTRVGLSSSRLCDVCGREG